MKQFLLVILKYILILISVFTLFFIILFIMNLLPAFIISMKEKQLTQLFWSVSVPAFYHSFFNSLVISVFIFDIMIFNYEKNNRIALFFIPILLSCIFLFSTLFFLKPVNKDLIFTSINDARIYFKSKCFFEHNGKKYYFDNVSKEAAENIIIFDKTIITVKSGRIVFLEDSLLFSYTDDKGIKKDENFIKDNLRDYNLINPDLQIKILKLFENISYKFFYSKNLYVNIFLWFAVAFFILSFTLLFKFRNYPFLTLIYNIFFLVLFYFGFNGIFDFYDRLFLRILKQSLIRDVSLSIIILIFALLLQAVRIVFFRKSNEDFK